MLSLSLQDLRAMKPPQVAGAHLLLGAKLKNTNSGGRERERAKAQQ